jgi:hypothetical protein
MSPVRIEPGSPGCCLLSLLLLPFRIFMIPFRFVFTPGRRGGFYGRRRYF